MTITTSRALTNKDFPSDFYLDTSDTSWTNFGDNYFSKNVTTHNCNETDRARFYGISPNYQSTFNNAFNKL